MPCYPIDRSTNFIVEDESWTVIEYDHTSVPGVIYLSLTENKVNMIYDDLANDIADTDKLAQYNLSLPIQNQSFAVDEEIKPVFTLTKNGIPIEASINIIPKDTKIAKVENGRLKAVAEGSTELIIQLAEYPQIIQTLPIVVSSSPVNSAYIEGPATLRLDKKATYTLVTTQEFAGTVVFAIDNSLATIENADKTSCVVHANANNKLGTCVLSTIYNNEEYTKEIKIIPLW